MSLQATADAAWDGPDRTRVPRPEDARRSTLIAGCSEYGACADRAEFDRAPEDVPAGAERNQLVQEQRAICRSCPVWDFCRELGLRDLPRTGMAGGLTTGQRYWQNHLQRERLDAARKADAETEARLDARDARVREARTAWTHRLDGLTSPAYRFGRAEAPRTPRIGQRLTAAPETRETPGQEAA